MSEIVSVKHLGIRFQNTEALKDVTFSINEGEIFGFLGPSGAGKTTTIKLLTNQLIAGRGEIQIFGKPLEDVRGELFEQIGVLSDNSGVYDNMSVYENLKIFADLKKVPHQNIDEILKKTKLMEAANKKAKILSKGMKQRLIFARAILHKPKILFLDEPTSALDPATSEDVYQMIHELKNEGTTIFLTTHNMSEAQYLCDRVAFLNEGEIKEMGSPEELCLKYAVDEVEIITDTGCRYQTTRNKDTLTTLLDEIDGNILRIRSIEPNLKTIFLHVTGRELS